MAWFCPDGEDIREKFPTLRLARRSTKNRSRIANPSRFNARGQLRKPISVSIVQDFANAAFPAVSS